MMFGRRVLAAPHTQARVMLASLNNNGNGLNTNNFMQQMVI